MMKEYLKQIVEAYIRFIYKLTSLRFFVLMVSLTMLSQALVRGLINGSDYVWGVVSLVGLFFAGRTITHFKKENEVKLF